ncbi:hypothetical protein L596_027173 [Steinernema carpocapsae]|uniref:Uncharacterized protein n=1 Tax=Steinernema carpocapsae TaxID=34508 RepID=A0A4U5M4K4_STECR|nr:hypothetical protein L596_027173 [Steinernema carpocapsae]
MRPTMFVVVLFCLVFLTQETTAYEEPKIDSIREGENRHLELNSKQKIFPPFDAPICHILSAPLACEAIKPAEE